MIDECFSRTSLDSIKSGKHLTPVLSVEYAPVVGEEFIAKNLSPLTTVRRTSAAGSRQHQTMPSRILDLGQLKLRAFEAEQVDAKSSITLFQKALLGLLFLLCHQVQRLSHSSEPRNPWDHFQALTDH